MLKKTSLWATLAAVALVGLSLSGGSVAFADPPCPPAERPCPPGKDGVAPGNSSQGVQNQQGAGEGQRHGAFGVVDQKSPGTDTQWVLLTKQGPVEIKTGDDTRCKLPGTKGPGSDEDCDQILNGHYVSVQWTVVGDDNIARSVHLNRGRSLHEHCRGVIPTDGIDNNPSGGKHLAVECRTDGESFTRIFTIVDGSTKFGPNGVDGLGNLAVGDEVMVVAARDGLLASDLYTAKVVHKLAD